MLLIGFVWWTTLLGPGPHDDFTVRLPGPVGVLVLTAASVGLLARRRNPALCLALTVGADLASVVLDLEGLGYHYAGLFGVFFVATSYSLGRAVALAAPAMGLVYLAEVVNAGGRSVAFAPVWVIISTALALGFGQVRYLREHLVVSLQEQVDSAERTREAVARTRVAEDRLQTARELHDVVGHRIAVVHLRAAAALRSLDDDPETTRRGLVDIDHAARDILVDIDQLLADLRADEPAPALDHGPVRIERLLDEFRSYGLTVRARIDGQLSGVPPQVAWTAHQALTEALTNALKHGGPDAVAELHVRLGADALDLRVSNPIGGAEGGAARDGWGLRGLRERVSELGGRVNVTRGTDFVLEITLPTARAAVTR
ncbi:histidine kinase [Nocardioides sp. YIM 152588]|uniref:sensor histidine kinase n=1 Tax=Nocardioides sp. YIM 152588 TaxID=3158259 RepID=UPI0032E42470